MEKIELKLLCHSSKENGLKALSSSVLSRKPKHEKLLPGLQPVEKGSQQVDSTGSPMIMDEIEKAEIPPPETSSDGDDEHSELEENLCLVFLALSQGQEHQRKHLANVSLRTKWFPQGPHLPHVRHQLETCHLPSLVMTRMTGGL